jgi:heat-inducible transcriptional repressor
VQLAPHRLLAVLILSTGRVEQRLVELEADLADDDLAALRSRISRAAIGEQIADAVAALRRVAEAEPGPTHSVVEVLIEAMSDHRSDERIAVGGAANLARFGDSFESSVRPLLEALEEHVVLLKLLGEATQGGMVRRPDQDGLPRHDGSGASRRPLRLADPRRGLSPPPLTRLKEAR